MTRRILLLTLATVLTSSLLNAQGTGRISGNVIREDGTTVEGANVCISETSGNHTTTICRNPVDNVGHFEIDNVKFGSYGVFAVNEEEGYSIDNQSPGLKVNVTPANSAQNITIRLLPRGGILTGSVSDKVSGKAIGDAHINYVAIDNGGGGGSRLTVGGKFSMVAPTGSTLLIYVSAQGYRGWVYNDGSNSASVVRLAPGERRMLNIELEPLLKTSEVR